MQYSSEVIIDLPRDEMLALFDSTENLFKWQEGLQSFDHLSGEPGQPGAKSKLVFDMGGRQMEMIETITGRDLPDSMSMTYEMNGVFNTVHNRFVADGDKTRWVADHEFKFSGAMALMSLVMRGSFPKQTQATMDAFKVFAESQSE